MTVDLLTYGETMGLLDADRIGPLRLGGPLRLSMAGAESTVAIGVARLGGSARWVGAVGADEVGVLITRVLRAEGVQTDGVTVVDDVPTGLMLKERRSAGLSRVNYYRRGNAGSRLSPEHVRPEDIADAKILHLSGITPALSATAREAVFHALDLAERADTTICVDLNYRAALWSPGEARSVLAAMVARAGIVLATAAEAALLIDGPQADAAGAARHLSGLGPRLAVVKRGADGAVACDDGRIQEVAPCPAEVVDPVGAGDAFAAGLLADLALGHPAAQALETAASVAAVNVACPGDWEGLPTRADLHRRPGDDVLR
jgi:2-dehydro-3-deoxygluconokinase